MRDDDVGGFRARSAPSVRSAFAVSGWLTGVSEGDTSHVCHLETAPVASGASRNIAIRVSGSEQLDPDRAPPAEESRGGL
jgi:hypothetical protein